MGIIGRDRRNIQRTCPICTTTYDGPNLTCSRPCGNALRNRSNTRGEQRPCPVCGTSVHVMPSTARSRTKVTCSEACQAVAHSRMWEERRPMIDRACPVCDITYRVDEREFERGKHTTCSRPCSYWLRMKTRKTGVNPRAVSEEHRREARRLKGLRHHTKHREELNRKQSAYIKAHPEVAMAAQEKRRARKMGAPVNDLTRKQWRAIREAFGHRCAYCGQTFERLTMDHVIPLSKGGGHTANNIVPACKSCNCRKATKLISPRFLPEDSGYLVKI